MAPKRKAAQEANTANKKIAAADVAAQAEREAAAMAALRPTLQGPDDNNKRAPPPYSKPVSPTSFPFKFYHYLLLLLQISKTLLILR